MRPRTATAHRLPRPLIAASSRNKATSAHLTLIRVHPCPSVAECPPTLQRCASLLPCEPPLNPRRIGGRPHPESGGTKRTQEVLSYQQNCQNVGPRINLSAMRETPAFPPIRSPPSPVFATPSAATVVPCTARATGSTQRRSRPVGLLSYSLTPWLLCSSTPYPATSCPPGALSTDRWRLCRPPVSRRL
jgi:hypothetical protein